MKKNKLKKSKQNRARTIHSLKGLKQLLRVLARTKKKDDA